jgi:hypothetical protein
MTMPRSKRQRKFSTGATSRFGRGRVSSTIWCPTRADGIEGIVSKKKDGRYRSGRSSNWSKVTCRKRDTFVVAGIAYKGAKFDGIYLGRREKVGLVYAGKVEHGFSAAQKKALMARAAKFASKTQPVVKKIAKPKAKWLQPKLLVDVEYRANKEPAEPDPDKTEYFYQCPLCGQWVDGRDMDQVDLHEQPLPHPPGVPASAILRPQKKAARPNAGKVDHIGDGIQRGN